MLRQIQRVHEAQPLERLVLPRLLEIRMLDVQRRDVVRQEHDLVGEQPVLVDVLQLGLGDAADEVDDEVAGAGAGVDDVDVVAPELLAELLFQHLGHRLRT